MNKKYIYIFVFIVSVLGLLIIQYRYLRIGLNLAKVKFDQNIAETEKSIRIGLSYDNELTFLLGKAATRDTTYFKIELDSIKEASNYFLNDFFKKQFVENGLTAKYSYRLYTKDNSLDMYAVNYNKAKKNETKHFIELKGYLPSLLQKKVFLEFYFLDTKTYFLSQLNGVTIPSLIFLIAIVIVVIWVLKSFYWQQNVITLTNDFINNLTHELKTPVFSIGLASSMLGKKSKEEDKIYIAIIKEQNERLKGHINNVLELSILEKRKSLYFSEIDFLPHITKLCKEFALLAKIENVEFISNIADGNYCFKCEPNHLINAINNLLDNAKKYRQDDAQIVLSVSIEKKQLSISVMDNGIGIAASHQRKIFKKHYRVSSGDSYNVKGYGLGLNYTHEIIKLHKGKITLKSSLGEGTCIKITIPIK